MPTNSKKSIKEIIFLSLGIVIIGGSAVSGFVVLANVYSRLITNPIFYPLPQR